jgi:hypothetical protein
MERRWGGGSGARTNKSASTPLPHQHCPSWRHLGVDGIVCLLIPRVGDFKFLGWCRRGRGGDPIRCAHPSALSPLLRRLLRHGGAHRMYCPGVRTDGFCVGDRWKMVYHVLGLWMEAGSSDPSPPPPDVVVVRRCQFWNSIACPRTCCLDSFNANGFASGKLLWRFKKLLISDGVPSSLDDVVICLPPLWRSLRWCRRRRIGVGFFAYIYPIFSVL